MFIFQVLQHKQSYLNHLKVVHGNFFGSNKWKGSSVVDFILEQSRNSPKKNKGGRGGGPEANAAQCTLCEAVFPNPSSLRNHVVNVHVNGSSHTCQLCGKAFLNQENLDAHTKSKHPNLTKRLQALREALGIEGDLDGILQPPDINANTLPSNAVQQLSVCNSSLSLSTPSESNIQRDSSPVNAEVPLNLSTTSSKDSPTSSTPCPSSSISNPPSTQTKPAASSSVTVQTSKVDLPSAPVPAKDLAEVAKQQPPPPPLPSLPSSPVPIGDIIVAVNNNNDGEGGDGDDDDDEEGETSGGGGGGRKKSSICKVCGIVLSPKTNVNVHMRTHSGARPYQCALCLSRFRQKAHLMKHFRCSHNMKRPPFVCLFCPEETATSNDLYRHITDRHRADTDALVRAKGIQAPPEADEVDEHLQPIKPSRAQQQMLQKQAQLVSSNASAAALALASVAAVPEFPSSLTTMQPEPPQLQQPESPQPPQEAEIPQQVILPQQPLPMEVPQPMEVTQEEQQASPEGSNPSSEDDDDVRYEPITEPFLFEGQVIYPCYCILPYISDAEVEASCRRSINVSATFKRCIV